MDKELGHRILALRERIVSHFDAGDWEEIGFITGHSDAINAACVAAGLRSLRADDIWEESTVIQDIFNLLLRARIVVVDFTGRNPNVMYETGIAHTLGKLVVPVSQSLSDVPFDMAHHRCLKYLPNAEGYSDLTNKLTTKLAQVGA